MSHSVPSQENQTEDLSSSELKSSSPTSGDGATLPPPPFSVTANNGSGTTALGGANSQLAPTRQQQSSMGGQEPSNSPEPHSLAPPPFSVTASPAQPGEVAEEEKQVREKTSGPRYQTADGGPPANPNDGSSPPSDPSQSQNKGAVGKQASRKKGTSSSGEPLPEDVRLKMEQSLKGDFSKVRVHKNSKEASELGVRAFARGNHIHFAPGQYQPSTLEGQKLLGHELAHVLQQTQGRVKPSIQAKGTPRLAAGGPVVNTDPGMEREADQLGAEAANSSEVENENGNSEDDYEGIVPRLMLFGERLDINLSQVENTTTVKLNLELFPGLKINRIDAVIEDGAFVSGTLYLESSLLSGIDLQVSVNAEGEISAQIHLEHEIMGFQAEAFAQLTAEGISGNIMVKIPAGFSIFNGLETTGGNLYLTFGGEETSFQGNVELSLNNGFATGSAQVALDPETEAWSGSFTMQSSQSINLSVAQGVDVILPEGFQFGGEFGGEDGFTMHGGALITAQVTLASTDGLEAGGTAELEVKLGSEGLDFVLHKIRLAVSGGLNAPDINEMLESQHLTSDVDAGALLTLWFKDNSLTQMDLEATAGINSPSKRIGRFTFSGQARFNPFRFIGMLHAITGAAFVLNQGAKYTTSVMAGSQFFLSLEDSGITNIDASIGLEVADPESALAQLKVASALTPGQGLDMEANLDLLKRIDLTTVEENGYGVSILPATGLGATVEGGNLKEIVGALQVEVDDQEGDLLAGSLTGRISVSDSALRLEEGSASGTLSRNLTIDMGSGSIQVAKDTGLNATFEDGKVTGLGGDVSVLYTNGEHEYTVQANMDYDPSNRMVRSLDASVTTEEEFDLFNLFTVSGFSLGLSIRENELVSAGASAGISGEYGNVSFEGDVSLGWSNQEGDGEFVGGGSLQLTWNNQDDPDKYLHGQVEFSLDGEEYHLSGSAELGVMEGLSGSAGVKMGHDEDLAISASLTYGQNVLEGSELWGEQFDMPLINAMVFPLVFVTAGLKFGASIATRPLNVFGTVGITDWNPGQDTFPDFHAVLGANWGIDLDAKALAYLGITVGIKDFLHAEGGVNAGVGLNIPIELEPSIGLFGSEEGVWGELALELSIKPILELLIEAYFNWSVIGIWDGEMTKELMRKKLAGLGELGWSGSLAFGDREQMSGELEAPSAQVVEPTGADIPVPKEVNEDTDLGYEGQGNGGNGEPGIAGLLEGLNVPGSDGDQGIDSGGLTDKFKQVAELADGVAAAGKLLELGFGGIKHLMKGQIIRFIIWLIWNKPDESELKKYRDKVENLRQTLLQDHIPNGGIIDRLLLMLAGRISFWTAIFNPSRPFQILVDDGVHMEADLEERAEIVNGMIKGWTTNGDEARILVVLNFTFNRDGKAALRELMERCGGYQNIRDQYESFLGQDKDERKRLEELHKYAYGYKPGEQPANGGGTVQTHHGNIPALDVKYTATPGATVERGRRSWEELAEEAYGDVRYVLFLNDNSFNATKKEAQEAYQEAWDAYMIELQNHDPWSNPNETGSGGPPIPFEDDDTGNNYTPPPAYQGPPRPEDVAYIPTREEIIDHYEEHLVPTRLATPGQVDSTFWFETFELIAGHAYGDASMSGLLRAYNSGVREWEKITTTYHNPGFNGFDPFEDDPDDFNYDPDDYFTETRETFIVEGSSLAIPGIEDLPPPLVVLDNQPIGSTGHEVGVTDEGDGNIFMWIDEPEHLLTEIAQRLNSDPESADTGSQLMEQVSLSDGQSPLEVENAMKRTAELLEYIVSAGLLTLDSSGEETTPLDQAQPGDYVSLEVHDVRTIAQRVYSHAERAAWITVFNLTRLDRSTALLPTQEEMRALDPLPLTARGLAPDSVIRALDGDTWASLAMKVYGDWSLAVSLSEWPANQGIDFANLPSIETSEPSGQAAQAAQHQVAMSADGSAPGQPDVPATQSVAYTAVSKGGKDGLTSTNINIELPPNNLITLPAASQLSSSAYEADNGPTGNVSGQHEAEAHGMESTSDGEGPAQDNRTFSPGSNLIVQAGDTWSAIAKATYNDFSLFVKLSNHPKNATFKTLPEGCEIYLPTLVELEDVPEFGLGLSPTGKPLLTEILRVPTAEEVHHVWVENQGTGSETKGIWMMASTPFALEPETEIWMDRAKFDTDILTHVNEVNRLAKKGEESIGEIETVPNRLRQIVEAKYLEEGEEHQDGTWYEVLHDDGGINMRKESDGTDLYLANVTKVKILQEGQGQEVKIGVIETGEVGFISEDTRFDHLVLCANLDEFTVGAIQNAIDLASGVFAPASGEAERLIEQTGEAGMDVPVKVGSLARGEMRVFRNEAGFQSVNDEYIFMEVDAGLLGEFFGGNLKLGIQARVRNDGVDGEAVCEIGGQVVSTKEIAKVFSGLDIPGIQLGNDFANTTFVNGFYENDFRIQFLNIPIVTGNNFKGTLDIGLVNGELSITGRAIVQVTPSIMGVVELEYGPEGFSGEGSIQFMKGPLSGDLTVKVTEDGVTVSGTGTVISDQFSGSATIVYGRQSYVDEIINPELSNLSDGGELNVPDESYQLEEGTGEYVLAGFVDGTIPLSDKFDANAKGIVDSTGGLTLAVDIGNSETIPLTDPMEEFYDLELPVPVFTWGIPQVISFGLNLNFFFGIGYEIGALELREAVASGVYSNSTHSLAPEDSLSLKGKIGMDTALELGGGLSIGGKGQAVGNEATAEIGARVNAMLSASTELAAEIGVKAGEDGIDPNFKAEAGISALLELNLQGFFKGDFDAWGNWLDESWTHYFANVNLPVGSMNLNIVYDPSEEQPLNFVKPDNKEIFEFNSWKEMVEKMYSNDNANADDVDVFEAPTGEGSETGDGPLTAQKEAEILGVQAAYQNQQGEIHTLKYEEDGNDIDIWRHSVPMKLEDYCDELIKHHQEAGNSSEVGELQEIKTYLLGEDWQDTMKNSMSTGELRAAAFQEIREIATQLEELDESQGPLPKEAAWPSPEGGGRPTNSKVDNLHNSQNNQGETSDLFKENSSATYDSDSMSTSIKWLKANGLSMPWIKFHIINHRLGGKANKENLIAARTGDNSDYHSAFEFHLKNLYEKGKVVWMEADIDYHGRSIRPGKIPNEVRQAFPRRIRAKGGAMTYHNGAWTRLDAAALNYDISPELPSVPSDDAAFECNDSGSYNTPNLQDYGIWKSNGQILENHVTGGGQFSNDFEEFENAIFPDTSIFSSGSEYDPKAWPSFKLEDLPEVSGGLLTFLKNESKSKKRTLKHFMHMIFMDRVKF